MILVANLIPAVLIPVALYLPGHFLGALLARKGDAPSELALLRVVCAAALAAPVLTALALLGWFVTPVVLGVFGVCAVVSWRLSRKGENLRAGAGRWDLALPFLLAGSLALNASGAAEYVLKDRDPGVYAVVAAKLARTGELLSRDPLVGTVSSFHEFEHGAKFPGFFVYGTDLVVPQFFPGSFVLMGLGDLAGGIPWGALYVAPVFGALSVGLAFVLGKELFGRWAGLLGALLLAASYAQVWWARSPSSEVITQFFLLAGLWSAARYVRGGGGGTGVLAGALLGGAMLVRVDAFLATLVVSLLVGRDLYKGRPVLRRWAPVCVPLLLSFSAMLLYAGTVGGRYLDLIRDLHVPDLVPQLLPYLLGAALLASVALLLLRKRARRQGRRPLYLPVLHERSAAPVLAVLAPAAALSLVGVALWAYFVLPESWEGLPESWGGPENRMANFHAYDRQVAVRMVWFVTPAVAVLAMAGLVLAARRLDEARGLFLGAVLAFGLLYVALPNVAPDLPWATRRFVPVVFPGLCLLAGYAISESWRVLGSFSVRAGASCAVVLAVLAFSWTVYAAWPIYGVRELEGAVKEFESLNDALPNSRVAYFEPPTDDHAATLDYLYGRPALVYDREQLRREAPDLLAAGLFEDAVYVTTGEAPEPTFPGLALREVGREELSYERLEDSFKEVPYGTHEERQELRIYALEQTP